MTVAPPRRLRALSRLLPQPAFRISGTLVVLSALMGPVWDVVALPTPGVSLTLGRALILATALSAILDLRAAPRPLRAVPRAVFALTGALVAIWLWIVVSDAAWGCRCAGELAGFSELVALVVIASVVSVFAPRVRPAVVIAVIAGAALTSALTLAGLKGLTAGTAEIGAVSDRLSGPYGNANMLAFALACALPAGVAWYGACHRRGRIVLGAALALITVVLVLTFSRGGLLTAALGVAVVLILGQRRGSRAQLTRLAGIAAAGMLAVALYPSFVQWRQDSNAPQLAAQLRALDESGWDGGAQGLIGGGPAAMSNPAPEVLEVRTTQPRRGVSRPLGAVQDGESVVLRFRARALDASLPVRFAMEDNLRGNGPVSGTAVLGRSWQRLQLRWRPTAASRDARLYVWTAVGSSGFQLRGVSSKIQAPSGSGRTLTYPTALRGSAIGRLQAIRRATDARDIRSRQVGAELSLQAFGERPLRGIGWGRFTEYTTTHSEFQALPTHNEYLRFLAELGVIGIALLAFVGWVVMGGLLHGPRDRLALALFGVLVTGATGLVFVNGLVTPSAALPLMLAAAATCARVGGSAESEVLADTPPWSIVQRAIAMARRAPACAVVVIARGALELRGLASVLRRLPAGMRRLAPPIRPEGTTALVRAAERWLARAGRGEGANAIRVAALRIGRPYALATAGLVALSLVLALAIGPHLQPAGAAVEGVALELGEAQTPRAATAIGAVTVDVDGYRVDAASDAIVRVPVALSQPAPGARTLLRVWAYGPAGVRTTVVLRSGGGVTRALGRPGDWVGRTFDVTAEARRGSAVIEARAHNATNQSQLFLDRLLPVVASQSLRVSAPAWAVGLLVVSVTLALLALVGRLRPHWPLAGLLAATAVVAWPEIVRRAFEVLPPDRAVLWDAATSASWLGLDDGLLWGMWGRLPALPVQLFHLLTPIVGTGTSAIRAASLLAGLLALAALYALGHRVCGRAGAIVVVLLALASGAFREALIGGGDLPVLVLAAALFCYALHACLHEATTSAIVLLGGSVALLALADPTWLPGALGALVVVALVCARRGRRAPILMAGALTVIVLLLPHLASTARQNDGHLFAEMNDRAVAARNVEFKGAGHGAPTAQQLVSQPDPRGRPVTLPGYVLGDHSAAQLLDGLRDGTRRSANAFARGWPLGLLALLAGALYLLALARARLLVLLALLVAGPTLLFAGRAGADPATAGAVVWVAILAGAAMLVHAIAAAVRSRYESARERLRVRVGVVAPGVSRRRRT